MAGYVSSTGKPPLSMPPSCTSMAANCAALGCMLLALAVLHTLASPIVAPLGPLIAMGAYALPLMALEIVVFGRHRQQSSGLCWQHVNGLSGGRLVLKLVGFYGTLVLCFAVYWAFPEYQLGEGQFYAPYWQMLRLALPWLVVLAPAYLIWIDRHQRDVEDGYHQLGLLLCGRWSRVVPAQLGQHLLGWLVKVFFLALMFVYACNDYEWFLSLDFGAGHRSFRAVYDLCFRGFFFLDVLLAATGYMVTLRLFDSHLRSTEPTALGWCSALVCYQPFWSLVQRQYLAYDRNGYVWGAWLEPWPVVYVVWGAAILLLVSIYLWATLTFGLRFSNLTHRGILTNGPYRFCKHPAYVAKNLSWWMIQVPFLDKRGLLHAIKSCLRLVLLNVIYWVRAITEERHLGADQTYVTYARSIAHSGLVARLRRRLVRQQSPGRSTS